MTLDHALDRCVAQNVCMVDQDLVRDLLNDPPKLHIWGGTPQVGGMNKQIGNRIIELMGDLESPAVMETGAGVSTMLFLLLGARPMTTIAPLATTA